MFEDKDDIYGTDEHRDTNEPQEDTTYRMNFTMPTPDPESTPDPEPTPNPDPTPNPESTPDPEPTPNPDPTPNLEPTPEPQPQPTPDPTPQAGYNPPPQAGYNPPPQSGGQSRRERSGKRGKREKRKRPFFRALLCGIICGVIILACLIVGFAIGGRMLSNNTRDVSVSTNDEKLASSSDETASDETASEETEAAEQTGQYTVAQIAEQCGSSVVAITNQSVQEVMSFFGTYEEEIEGEGSGVIVGLTDDELLIATNYHVVEEANTLSVCFFDSEDAVYSAQIKGTDENNDLAVVAVTVADMSSDVLERISIATMGDSDSMKVGDEVVAIGNALGLGQSVTSGIISAKDREVTIDDYTANLIQTDAAINPGNSGGALFNMQGELIGINSAKFASETIEGMGYAIPTSTAQPIIETLMSQQTRTRLDSDYGWLNISGRDISSDMTSSYGMPQGVYVTEAEEGGAAANAGIQTGDIITALDGISLTSIEALRERLHYYEAGETVEVTVERNEGNGYEPVNLVVTLDNASDYETASSTEEEESGGEDDYGDGGYGGYGDEGDNGYYYYGDGGSDSSDIFDYFFGR